MTNQNVRLKQIILHLKLIIRRQDTDIRYMEKKYNDKFKDEINKLKEENQKLEKLKTYTCEFDRDSEMDKLKKTIINLKSEVKKMKKEIKDEKGEVVFHKIVRK